MQKATQNKTFEISLGHNGNKWCSNPYLIFLYLQHYKNKSEYLVKQPDHCPILPENYMETIIMTETRKRLEMVWTDVKKERVEK